MKSISMKLIEDFMKEPKETRRQLIADAADKSISSGNEDDEENELPRILRLRERRDI